MPDVPSELLLPYLPSYLPNQYIYYSLTRYEEEATRGVSKEHQSSELGGAPVLDGGSTRRS
jgi:hypothetical protein